MSSEQLGEYLLAYELKDGSKPFAAFADNTEHFTLPELLTYKDVGRGPSPSGKP